MPENLCTLLKNLFFNIEKFFIVLGFKRNECEVGFKTSGSTELIQFRAPDNHLPIHLIFDM